MARSTELHIYMAFLLTDNELLLRVVYGKLKSFLRTASKEKKYDTGPA
jgi:hypothetical protein